MKLFQILLKVILNIIYNSFFMKINLNKIIKIFKSIFFIFIIILLILKHNIWYYFNK